MVRVHGIFVGPRDRFEEMVAALAAMGTRPVIDSVFGLSKGGEAFDRLQAGGQFGKIVISMAV